MPRRVLNFWVRAHGKYHERDGYIHSNDLHRNCIIKFYGPPGYAMSGGLADYMLGNTHLDRSRILGQRRRRNPADAATPSRGRVDRRGVREFTRRGYSHPAELGYSNKNKIRNYTISGEDMLDGQRAGIYYRTNGWQRPHMYHRLWSGEKMTLKSLVNSAGGYCHSHYGYIVVLHYIQCRSFARANFSRGNLRPVDSNNFKQGFH